MKNSRLLRRKNPMGEELMKNSTYKFVGILVAGLFVTQTAQAIPVTWSLDVEFDDNGTAVGTFTYDADTNIYSAIDVVTSGGNLTKELGGLYQFEWSLKAPTANNVTLQSNVPDYDPCGGLIGSTCILDLFFATALTNAGGTINVTSASFEGSYPDLSGLRIVTTGSVTAVPIPAAAWLFGSGLLGLVGVARRKRRNIRIN